MSGCDCWWFEYGGMKDTIADEQSITIELKRLVLGVWNYIKNSGKFKADNYTLEWIGNIAGKRESRRMTQGGPARATTTLSIEVFTTAFKNWDMGKAATVGTIWAVLLAFFSFIYLKQIRDAK